MKKTLYTILAFFTLHTLFAGDGVLIGDKGAGVEADNSAELEVYSTSKGVLLPIVTNLAGVDNPATGLIVFNDATKRYNYYDGAGWIEFPFTYFSSIIDDDGDTYVSVESTAGGDEDKVEFVAEGNPVATIDASGINITGTNATLSVADNSILNQKETNNTFLGIDAGDVTTGADNTFVGVNAGKANTTGSDNTYLGGNAGVSNTGSSNTFVGSSAGANGSADGNTAVGYEAGNSLNAGVDNVFVGYQSGYAVTDGSNNVFIGNESGYNSGGAGSTTTGSNNVIIGNGEYLASGTSDQIQIGKIMSADITTGLVTFNNQYVFPATAGNTDETLVLGADDKTLEWEAAGVSEVDVTVIGSASAMYTFDFGAKSADVTDFQYNTFLVAVTPESNSTLTQMMTFKKTTFVTKIQMGIYDASFQKLGQTGLSADIPSSPKTAFVTQDLETDVDVIKGETYYLVVRSTAYTDFAGSALEGQVLYLGTDANCYLKNSNFVTDTDQTKTYGNLITDLPEDMSTNANSSALSYPDVLPKAWRICTTPITQVIPWVRAF